MHICLITRNNYSPRTLDDHLASFGYTSVATPLSFFEKEHCDMSLFDCIIFDTTDSVGLESDIFVLQKIRGSHCATPIMLATHTQEKSSYREVMLDNGADGCIQTPFLKEELQLRLEKLVNKKEILFQGTVINSHNVTLDLRNHVVEKSGQRIFLTRSEYKILFHLFLHKNSLVTTEDLSLCLEEPVSQKSQALAVHIFNVRHKIGSAHLIKTIPQYGFLLSDMYSAK